MNDWHIKVLFKDYHFFKFPTRIMYPLWGWLSEPWYVHVASISSPALSQKLFVIFITLMNSILKVTKRQLLKPMRDCFFSFHFPWLVCSHPCCLLLPKPAVLTVWSRDQQQQNLGLRRNANHEGSPHTHWVGNSGGGPRTPFWQSTPGDPDAHCSVRATVPN